MKNEERIATNDAEGGFTLLEVSFVLVLAILMILALHQTVSVSVEARRSADRKYQVSRMAEDYLIKIGQLQFGKSTDPAPTATQLSELFDDDDDLGTITLHQLEVPPGDAGHSFTTATNEVRGSWRVKVTNDLDGDGSTTGPREGRDDLFKIEVYFENRLTLETMRAAAPEFTTLDSVVGG